MVDAWFELNYRLQKEAIDSQINKTFVQQWMMRLGTIKAPRPQCFWLFLARINELALFCTSRYVDCCEFAFADELLKEPGTVLLHVKGGRPVSGKVDTDPAVVLPRSALSRDNGGRPERVWKLIPTGKHARPLLPSLSDLLNVDDKYIGKYLCR